MTVCASLAKTTVGSDRTSSRLVRECQTGEKGQDLDLVPLWVIPGRTVQLGAE